MVERLMAEFLSSGGIEEHCQARKWKENEQRLQFVCSQRTGGMESGLPSLVLVQEVEGKGRGLFATQQIPSGTPIITETPFLAVPGSISDLIEPSSALAVQWWLLERTVSSSDELSRQASLLVSHTDDLDATQERAILQEAILCYWLLRQHGSALGLDTEGAKALLERAVEVVTSLFTRLCQIQSNVFALHAVTAAESSHSNEQSPVESVSQKRVGAAIFLHASMLNHSCRPNSHVHFQGKRLIVRASSDIRAGEELCISYGPLSCNSNTLTRQKQLQKAYFFLCACAECVSGEASGWSCSQCHRPLQGGLGLELECLKCHRFYQCEGLLKKQKRAECLLRDGDRFCDAQKLQDAERAFMEVLELNQELYEREDYHIGQACDRLAQVCAMRGDFEKAAAYCKRSVDIVTKKFGPNAIETAGELVKLTELYFNAR